MTLKDLGESIREKREASGLSIDDVAAQTKVSGRILTAIENGSTEGLPHTVYTKGFVRAFALVVGYDPQELAVCLEKVFPPESLENTRPEPGPVSRARPAPGAWKRMLFLALLLLILAGIAAGVWYVVSAHGEFIWETIKKPFSAVTVPSPEVRHGFSGEERNATQNAQGVSRAGQPRMLASRTAPSPMEQLRPEAGETPVSQTSPANAPQEQTPLPGQAESQQGATSPTASPASAGVDASGSVRPAAAPESQVVKVEARQRCWIRPRVDGVLSRDYILGPNETSVFSFKKSLELELGNAGVVVTHNGKPVTSIEKTGPIWVLKLP